MQKEVSGGSRHSEEKIMIGYPDNCSGSSSRNHKVSTTEKTAGFEVFLAITALILVITIRRNRG